MRRSASTTNNLDSCNSSNPNNAANVVWRDVFSKDDLAVINKIYHKISNVFFCENISDFMNFLELISSCANTNFDLLLAYQYDGHCTAVKVEHRENKPNLIIADSLGINENYNLLEGVIDKCQNCSIFLMKNKRQNDFTSCRVFTAKDLSKMAKTENLHQELEARSSLFFNGVNQNKIYLSAMPERFLVFAQKEGYTNGVDRDFVFTKKRWIK